MTDEAIVEKDHLLINALNLLAKILEGCGNALWEEAVVVNKLKSIFGEFCEIFLGIVFVRDLSYFSRNCLCSFSHWWFYGFVFNHSLYCFTVSVQELLLHEHEWVRIKSMDILWNIFQLQSSAAFSSNVIFAENTVDKV